VKQEIIDKHVCLCLHPSELPKYRGGTPIQNQIMNGETQSAVTIFKMGVGLDDGPVYFQEGFDLTGYLPEIFNRIELLGIKATNRFISDFKNNTAIFIEQNNSNVTTYKRLKPDNSEIKPEDFLNHDAEYFYNKVRSLQKPYPECFIKCKNGKIIIKTIDYE
jgi:methionyl-tRNA formyltransferase